MKLTEEQRSAVGCDEDVMLTACPGSGKTRVIISKLSRVIDTVRDTPRAVACITYTNAAVHEIEARLRYHIQPGDDLYFDVCTIHSFCLNHIVRLFCHLISGYQRGFKVLTPDNAEFEEYVTAVLGAHGRPAPTFADLEDFAQLRRGLDGLPVGRAIEHGGLTPEIAKDFWKRIREAGFIDFANIIYYALVLLRRRPEILSYISAKFAWILVDEFQDTTDLQVEIFSLIAATRRTRFFLVGDPCQSIFHFAGARPDLADEFASRIAARTDFTLSGNFRSSCPIICHANLLYSRVPEMVAVGAAQAFTDAPAWQHGTSAFDVITDYFLPVLDALEIPNGKAAILAPTWFSLFPLGRRLRDYGISIVGPGARPYRRNRQFAPLAEQVCGYMMEPRPEAIASIERTLFNTVLDITGRAFFDIFSYAGRITVFKLIYVAQALHAAHPGAVAWLEAAAKEVASILIAEGYLSRSEEGIFTSSVEEMKSDMRNKAALKLSTLHNAKGREYQAVAMIDLHEGRIPFYRATTTAEFEEAKRLFYVGVTRAKQFLLYVTDSSNPRNQPSRFLRNQGVGIC
jgi:DNA helicase-2/ATP-dependent DNA helicase PcrA